MAKFQYVILRTDRAAAGVDLKRGDYAYFGADCFGVASGDTRSTGVEHIAVSRDPSGVPFVTIPLEDVRPYVEQEAAQPAAPVHQPTEPLKIPVRVDDAVRIELQEAEDELAFVQRAHRRYNCVERLVNAQRRVERARAAAGVPAPQESQCECMDCALSRGVDVHGEGKAE